MHLRRQLDNLEKQQKKRKHTKSTIWRKKSASLRKEKKEEYLNPSPQPHPPLARVMHHGHRGIPGASTSGAQNLNVPHGVHTTR